MHGGLCYGIHQLLGNYLFFEFFKTVYDLYLMIQKCKDPESIADFS